MIDQNPDRSPRFGAAVGEALIAEGEERERKIQKAAADLQVEMEAASVRIRDLVLAQPPTGLLGYLWSQFFMGALRHHKEHGVEDGPDKDLIKQFQFVLEYVHAVWSSHKGPFIEGQVDEEKAKELIAQCDELGETAMFYGMASSRAGLASEFGVASPDMEFHAKSSWVLIRGHRYQVLEREFFEFALVLHDEALKKAYGIGAAEIAAGVQAIADAIRTGYSEAAEKLFERMGQSGLHPVPKTPS